MPSPLLVALLLLPVFYLVNILRHLLINLNAARATGLPYRIVPFFTYNFLAALAWRPIFRLLDRVFPNPSSTSWRRLSGAGWIWTYRHATFTAFGSDSFIVVAPGGNLFCTADPNVIAEVTARPADFPKDVEIFKHVDLYGRSIVSSEGAMWRRQRKVMSGVFSEKNSGLVWKETLEQTKQMLHAWEITAGAKSEHERTINSLAEDTMRLSLAVIGRAGLSADMEWKAMAEGSDKVGGKGEVMGYSRAMGYLLRKIFVVLLTPKWLLARLPFSSFQKANQAYVEVGTFLRSTIAVKQAALDGHDHNFTPSSAQDDLVSQMLKAQAIAVSENSISTTIPDGRSISSLPTKPVSNSVQLHGLTNGELSGNLFMLILAGHETAANSIHYLLLLLASHPSCQRQAQTHLSSVFGSRLHDPSTWNYERDFSLLLNGYLGAMLAEELRILSPVPAIPKQVAPGTTGQMLTIAGRQVALAPGMNMRLCVQAVHRNPSVWPYGPPRDSQRPYFPPCNLDNDLEEFKPERWLSNPSQTHRQTGVTGAQQVKPQQSLYTPPRGAYIPFSEGQRTCTGKRFAQVEILAALALILSTHSIELAVDDFASDDEIAKMSAHERIDVWRRAEEKARAIWQKKMKMVVTYQIQGKGVGVRIVRRGKERFADVDM